MRFLTIGVKDTKIIFRDKKALLMIVVMPLILIGILGASFGQTFSQNADIGEFKVAIVDKDHGQMGKEIRNMLENKEIKKLIQTENKNESEARQGIRDSNIVAALIIPNNFSVDVMAGKKVNLEIVADPAKSVKAGIFKGIIERFAGGASGITIGTIITSEQMAKEGMVTAIPAMTPKIIGDLQLQLQQPKVQIKTETTEGNKTLGSFQYYAAGMGAMFVLFSGMLGIKSIIEERNNQTLMRMMATPTTNTSILCGKFTGMVFTGFLQVLLMIILTRLIYGVEWGSSYFGIGLLALTTVFASTGICMFIASVSSTDRSAEMLTSIFINITSLLGGSMVPIHVFPKFLQNVSNVTINKWAIQGFTDLMLDKGFNAAIQPSLMLLAIGTVFVVLGAWRLRLN